MKRNYQSGQAMMEYMTLLPAAVMIMIGAGLIGSVLLNSFSKTVDGLEPSGFTCEAGGEDTAEREGPTQALLDDHSIELMGVVYDENADVTTFSYKVTSGPQPSISHWILGLTSGIAANITDTNEVFESYQQDPTTNVYGIKFDTGYEGGGGGSQGGGSGGVGGGRGGGRGGNSSNGSADSGNIVFTSYNEQTSGDSSDTSRTIIMMISGEYDFGSVTVAIKAGTQVHLGTISAPIRIHQGTEEECQ